MPSNKTLIDIALGLLGLIGLSYLTFTGLFLCGYPIAQDFPKVALSLQGLFSTAVFAVLVRNLVRFQISRPGSSKEP